MHNLKEVLNSNRQKYIDRLIELCRIDTKVLGQGIDGGLEKSGQDYLLELFSKMGADRIVKDFMTEEVIRNCIKEHNEGNPNHDYTDRYNVYATFNGKTDKTLMFNSHIDVMPEGDESLWKYPPFSPTIEDGKLFARGSADMKGGLMASVMAVELLKDANIELPCNVEITSVCDEEGGGNGSITAAMNGEKADGVVVCEGTNYELILASMGFIFFRIKIKGRENHSGAKWLGVSAVEKAIKVINALSELEHEWTLKYKHDLLPPPNLNVGTICGGTAASTVAGQCTLEACVHYIPDQMTYSQVYDEVCDAIRRVSISDKWLCDNAPLVEVYQAGGGFVMDKEHRFINDFTSAYKNVIGDNVKIVGSPAGCDSRIWKNIAKCPTIQYGPGSLKQCHATDEYLDIEEYLNTILIYAELILNFKG